MTLLACDLARDRKSTGAFAIYFLSLRRARNIIARNNISRKFLVFGVIGQPWLTINSFANQNRTVTAVTAVTALSYIRALNSLSLSLTQPVSRRRIRGKPSLRRHAALF
jgi:hypothetical protein